MVYGYARVSSKGQERYGNSLEDQKTSLEAAGCSEIYCDSFTGTKMDRPEFSKLLDRLVDGDTLVVTKLDRFARTAADGARTIQELLNRGVAVNVLNMGKADNTPMGKLMMTIMFAFAEFERDMIVERTQAGKALAKSTKPNWREGRKPLQVNPSDLAHLKYLTDTKAITVQEACRRLNISKASWYRLVTPKIPEK